MPQIDRIKGEVTLKVIYCGPGLSGKTTNLEVIHEKCPPEARGKLTTIAQKQARTIFFDLLPMDLGSLEGWSIKLKVYSVPGQSYFQETRKAIMQGLDGIVFVADSERSKLLSNYESLHEIEDILKDMRLDILNIPMVMQYNKRDLDEIMTVEEMNKELNKGGLPVFEAIAIEGKGIYPTLKCIVMMVLEATRNMLLNEPHPSQKLNNNVETPPPPPAF
jgi:signal recognition particle receptor subunit beta